MSHPKTIYWKIYENIKYTSLKVSNTCWQIKTQSTLKIESGEKKTIGLNFGYVMSGGVIMVIPAEDIKQSLEFINPIYCGQRTDNIIITVLNFSKHTMVIPENAAFCYVKYLKP